MLTAGGEKNEAMDSDDKIEQVMVFCHCRLPLAKLN